MSFPSSMVIRPAVAVAVLFALASVEAEELPGEPGLYAVRLTDGSLINLRVLTKDIEVTTDYGKLNVPMAHVRRMDVAPHDPETVQKRRHDDVIVTTMFPIVGRIEGQTLKVDSRIFGKVLLPLAHTLQVRSLTAEPEAAFELVERPRAPSTVPLAAASVDTSLSTVRLVDGSLVDLRLLTKQIDITTRDGKRKVPVADIRRIDVGFRYPEGTQRRVEAAVAQLGHANFRVRDAAGKELLRLKELAYPALTRAAQSANLETKRRATQLVRDLEGKLPDELLRVREDDVIVTPQAPIMGRIEGASLKVHSRIFGEGELQLVDTLQVRSLTAELMAARGLLERVRGVVRAGRTTRSELLGSGRNPYEELPKEGAC
jgi:hypothetical protein